MESQGLAALSLREVARRAGVSHQAPYHYFDDRQALLAAIACEGFRVLGQQLRTAREAAGEHPRAAMAEAYVRFASERPERFRLMHRLDLVDIRRFEAYAVALRDTDSELQFLRHSAANGAYWPFVHGLCTLLLDSPWNPLDDSLQARTEQALAAVREFEATLKRD